MAKIFGVTHTVNVAELKDNLGKYLAAAEKGDEVVICRRNLPVAKISSTVLRKNRSQPGWAAGTVKILGDIEGLAIPESDWAMLRPDFADSILG